MSGDIQDGKWCSHWGVGCLRAAQCRSAVAHRTDNRGQHKAPGKMKEKGDIWAAAIPKASQEGKESFSDPLRCGSIYTESFEPLLLIKWGPKSENTKTEKYSRLIAVALRWVQQ